MSEAPELANIAVLGDVHTEDATLELALAHIDGLDVDRTLCVGDIVDGFGDSDRCVELLEAADVLCVAGNHERWFLGGTHRTLEGSTTTVDASTRSYLEALPKQRTLSTPAGRLLLCHGVGDDDMAALRSDTKGYALQGIPTLRDLMLDPEVDYMLGGHTHDRMVRAFAGVTVVNAGTLHRAFEPGFLRVDFEAKTVTYFDLVDGAFREVAVHELPAPLPLR